MTLDGSASRDPNGDLLAFAWELTVRPAGSNATLLAADTAAPSFVPDVAGAYEATLFVTASGATSSDTVAVTAKPVTDDPPTISSIEAQRVVRGESLDVAFTIQDELPKTVTVTATASDPTLVPSEGLEMLGSEAERTLRITPNPAGTGNADLTLTATDAGGKTGSETFALSVEIPFQTQLPKLTARDGTENDTFGFSVAISGDYALVGAVFDDDNGTNSGSAYIYHRNRRSVFIPDSWNEVDKLTASDAAENDRFGVSVAISGEYALVGAYADDDNGTDSGSVYLYQRSANSWNEADKLTASDGAEGDFFGRSVAISGDYALVGAYADDDNGTSSGSAYVFRK